MKTEKGTAARDREGMRSKKIAPAITCYAFRDMGAGARVRNETRIWIEP